jgi:hypothetical protein
VHGVIVSETKITAEGKPPKASIIITKDQSGTLTRGVTGVTRERWTVTTANQNVFRIASKEDRTSIISREGIEMNHRIKMKEKAPFIRVYKNDQERRKDWPSCGRKYKKIPMPVRVHDYRKNQDISYQRDDQRKPRQARILSISWIGNKPSYLLDDGSWCFQDEIRGLV